MLLMLLKTMSLQPRLTGNSGWPSQPLKLCWEICANAVAGKLSKEGDVTSGAGWSDVV
jgi:hypothetical protein